MEWQKAAAARAAARKGMGFLKMTERKPVRLVAFDLDGTTLHGHAQLSARNRQAMERASAAGVLLVPATGRVKNFIPPCLTELPFIRYAITSNGGAVWDLREDRLLCSDLIPTETAMQVQRIFDDYPLYVEYYVNGSGVTRRGDPERAGTLYGLPEKLFYFLTKRYVFADSLSGYLRETGAEPEKINMMFIPEKVREAVLLRLRALDGIEITYSNVDNIEINRARPRGDDGGRRQRQRPRYAARRGPRGGGRQRDPRGQGAGGCSCRAVRGRRLRRGRRAVRACRGLICTGCAAGVEAACRAASYT